MTTTTTEYRIEAKNKGADKWHILESSKYEQAAHASFQDWQNWNDFLGKLSGLRLVRIITTDEIVDEAAFRFVTQETQQNKEY